MKMFFMGTSVDYVTEVIGLDCSSFCSLTKLD